MAPGFAKLQAYLNRVSPRLKQKPLSQNNRKTMRNMMGEEEREGEEGEGESLIKFAFYRDVRSN